MINAIIVDDETHCRRSLETQLRKLGIVEIIGNYGDVKDAKEAIKTNNPDLLFLDVELSDATGFELLKSLGDHEIDVIFTTAYDQYALKAIKASAFDYLLKPISLEELNNSISKFLNRKNKNAVYKQMQVLFEHYHRTSVLNNIALPMQTGIEFVNLAEIIRLESSSNYTNFYLADKRKITVPKTLKEYEELLSNNAFVRIHHSHIINLRFLEKYFKGDGGYVKMKDGSIVDVSRQRKEDFIKALGKL